MHQSSLRSRVSAFPAIAAITLTGVLIAIGCAAPHPGAHKGEPREPLGAPAAPATFATVLSDGTALLSQTESDEYLGDAVCGGCHTAIGKTYATSRHARTLRPVRAAEHGAWFRSAHAVKDAALGYTYLPGVASGRCVIAGRSAGGADVLAADYVMGAGRNALTFFSAERPDAWVDMRISYYTRQHKWDFTPGQRPGDRFFTRAAGITQEGTRLRACLSCHVTYLRAGAEGPDIGNSHIGIGCERCHGPGRAHINAVERAQKGGGRISLAMEAYNRATPERIDVLCGQCHHNASNSVPGDPKTENGLPRFEGVALVRSKCFQASRTLSCITCHDPHKDAGSESGEYVRQCLTCHAPTAALHGSAARGGKVCPVNPVTGCIPCHMPAQTIATIPHAKYHNHWIKVWKK